MGEVGKTEAPRHSGRPDAPPGEAEWGGQYQGLRRDDKHLKERKNLSEATQETVNPITLESGPH